MAELVDALDSKSGYRKVVQVRFLFWAQKSPSNYTLCNCFFISGYSSSVSSNNSKAHSTLNFYL